MPFGAAAGPRRRFPWTLQRVPSQRSANALFPEPTATHARGAVHETAVSLSSDGAGGGLAVGVVVQLVPFQDSANVVPTDVSVEPTASHVDAEAHATPTSVRDSSAQAVPHPPERAEGLACWSIVQSAPFQRSISGWRMLESNSGDCSPTATQLLNDVQDTLWSSTSPANGGVDCANHDEPFQASTSAPRSRPFGPPAMV
jgi:hypothetical protein